MYTLLQVNGEEKVLGNFDEIFEAVDIAESMVEVLVFQIHDHNNNVMLGVRSEDLVLWRRAERTAKISCGRFIAAIRKHLHV